MQNSESCLLKFQIEPVLDFIAQARSTHDLWSGSYLLSWLVAAGIKEALNFHASLIYPAAAGHPLLQNPPERHNPELLITNLPNIFISEVPTNSRDCRPLDQTR